MVTQNIKWLLVSFAAGVCIAGIWCFSNGRRPTPKADMVDRSSGPHLPGVAEVASLAAVIDGGGSWSLSTDKYVVPPDYYNEICAYFADREVRPWKLSDTLSVQINKDGELYFLLRDGRRLEFSFYDIGKGGTGFSIGDKYYQVDCADDINGALAIGRVLERARRATGIPAVAPRPPEAKDVVRLVGEIHQNSLGIPWTGPFIVQEQFYGQICDLLAGEISQWQLEAEVQETLPALGELSFIRKDGGRLVPFGIRFYAVGEGWIGFRCGDQYYRVRNKHANGVALLHILDRANHAAEELKKKLIASR